MDTTSPSHTAPPTSGSAIAAFILSLLGLLQVLPIAGTLGGLILGYSARKDIRASQGAIGGEGMAQAAIVIGWIGVAIYIITLCLTLLVVGGIITLPVSLGICAQLGTLQ